MKRIINLLFFLTLVLSACSEEANSTIYSEGIEAGASKDNEDTSSGLTENSTECTEEATFVEDITVPDYTNFDPGKTFIKTWSVKNSGTCPWTSEYSLVFALGEQMQAPDSTPLGDIGPGEETSISIELTAPDKEATYRADFQLVNPDGIAMPIDTGEYLWVVITVGTATAEPGGNSRESGGTDGPGLADATCGYTTDATRTSDVITAINKYRAQNGLDALTVNSQLNRAAQAHSADMACNQLFYHNGSNGSTPDSRVAAAGYSASSISENVYGSYPPLSGQEVVAWWATDQSDIRHNENLLTTKYTEIGIGYSFYDNFGYYVAVFAVP